MTSPFNPAAVAHHDIARRLKISSDAALLRWGAEHFPRTALPIDLCVRELLRKRQIRAPAGVCPYALARYGVVRAALQAGVEQEKHVELKPDVLEALKYLRDYGPKVRSELCWAEWRVHFLLEAGEQLGVSLPQGKPLLEAMSRSRRLLEMGSQAIASLHRELSKNPGNVWRVSFVGALFAEWWLLSGKDPKPSAGPCQNFICAAWCSLSPDASETDADWASAIKVALSKHIPGAWRNGRRMA